jgi:hypothetical protein
MMHLRSDGAALSSKFHVLMLSPASWRGIGRYVRLTVQVNDENLPVSAQSPSVTNTCRSMHVCIYVGTHVSDARIQAVSAR